MKDAFERKESLNIKKSFIIQAPAGSGKTEIIVQRYLSILSDINNNIEEIIILTFTKSASEEILSRILKVLEDANANNISYPFESYKNISFELAKKILSYSKYKELMNNKNSLLIMTIDVFCKKILINMNTKNNLIYKISDDIEDLYNKSIDNFIYDTIKTSVWKISFNHLLLHLDNDIQYFKILIKYMLKTREQWLPIIINYKKKFNFEINNLKLGFKALFESLMKNAYHLFNIDKYALKIIEVMNIIYPKLEIYNMNFRNYNSDIWELFITIIFTKQNKFRKKFNKIDKTIANWLRTYIDDLSNNKKYIYLIIKDIRLFHQYFHNPHEYDWKLLNSIFNVLIYAIQYLKKTFLESSTIDFNEHSLKTLASLIHSQHHSSFLYNIKHFLIDEFQDTSVLQFKLLERITLKWENNGLKTLFMVGDPMQSIYSFRKTEVSLFLQVIKHGINKIKLHYLKLSSNFRSTESVIYWINFIFSAMFPQRSNNKNNNAVISYLPSTIPSSTTSNCLNKRDSFTQLSFINSYEEAEFIANEIKVYHKSYSHHKIAILIRSRRHLSFIIKILKKYKISFIDHDIQTFYQNNMILDLLCLSCILSNEQQEIYWISLLQSKLFGFSLKEIHSIKNYKSKINNFEHKIKEYLKLNQEYAYQKKTYIFLQWLNTKVFEGTKISIIKKLKLIWKKLDGPIIYHNMMLYQEFIDILNDYLSEDKSIIIDTNLLIKKLKNTYITYKNPGYVYIMTIFKSKGLEFDFVILPQIHQIIKSNTFELFLYEKIYINEKKYRLFSTIPMKNNEVHNSLYKIIQNIKNKKHYYELMRLLYVAITRSKFKVLLTKVSTKREYSSSNNSFLSLLNSVQLDWKQIPLLNMNIQNRLKLSQYKLIKQIKNYTILPPNNEILIDEYEAPKFNDIILNKTTLIIHKLFNCYLKYTDKHCDLYFYSLVNYNINDTIKNKAYIKANIAINNTKKHYSWIYLQNSLNNEIILDNDIYINKSIPDRIFINKHEYMVIYYDFTHLKYHENKTLFLINKYNIYKNFVLKHYKHFIRNFNKNKTIIFYIYFPLLPYLFQFLKIK